MALQSMTALASITLESASASVTFFGIPQNYRDLVLTVSGPALTSGEGNLFAVINGDTGANYSRVFMSGTGSSAYSASASGETQLNFGYYQPNTHLTIAHFIDYSATNKHKAVVSRVNNTNGEVYAWASRWASSSQISSMLIDTSSAGLFSVGTTFDLYGRIG